MPLDMPAQVVVQQFILAILEFIRIMNLEADFQLQVIQQLVMAMELSIAMDMELTLLQLQLELNMELLKMQP